MKMCLVMRIFQELKIRNYIDKLLIAYNACPYDKQKN